MTDIVKVEFGKKLVDKLYVLDEDLLIDLIKKLVKVENALYVVRGLAVKELVERHKDKPLKQVIYELSKEVNCSYTTLLYDYKIVEVFGSRLLEIPQEELPSRNFLLLCVKSDNPEEFFEHYYHSEDKAKLALKEVKKNLGSSEVSVGTSYTIDVYLTDVFLRKVVEDIVIEFGSLSTFVLEKIREFAKERYGSTELPLEFAELDKFKVEEEEKVNPNELSSLQDYSALIQLERKENDGMNEFETEKSKVEEQDEETSERDFFDDDVISQDNEYYDDYESYDEYEDLETDEEEVQDWTYVYEDDVGDISYEDLEAETEEENEEDNIPF